MAVWITLVIIAQFVNAMVALVDKYILASGAIPRPLAYAFYLMLLSAFSVGIFFFSWVPIPIDGVSVPSFANILAPTGGIVWVSLLAGLLLLGALVTLFSAFKRADASDVIPVVGACSAVGALVLSYLLLDTALPGNFFFGFVLLVAGMFILSLYRFSTPTLFLSILSGILFASHFICMKALFADTNFDNAFFWTRMGIVAIALGVLAFPHLRKKLSLGKGKARRRAGALVIGNKVLAGLASIMLLKAIELGDVSIVQALGGLQFVFLLGLTALFSKSVVKACGETCDRSDVIQKTVAVTIITVGVMLLFL